MGGGHGFGEVLRSRESRHSDGAGCAEGQGQTGTTSDSSLSSGRNDGRRSGHARDGRERRKEAHFRLCYPTSCSTIWIRNWKDEVIRFADTRMTVTSTCKSERGGRTGNGESHALSLESRLRLKVNAEKSAVARPWERKFLGYSMTSHKQPRLKVSRAVGEAPEEISSGKRLRAGKGAQHWQSHRRGTNTDAARMGATTSDWRRSRESSRNWMAGSRRKLRCVLWRQWKRSHTRAKNLMKRGIEKARAWKSATNGRGPWWNAGASHMNEAFPKSYFDRCGLVSLLDAQRRLQLAS